MSIESQPAVPDAPLSEQKRRLLEKYLRGDVPSSPGAHDLIPRRPAGLAAPLSAGQHQIWLHSQMAPGLPLYNEPLTVHRIGPLDVAALEWSLCEILRRHEAWRTTVAVVGGEPVQVVQAVPRVALPVVDLRSLPEIEREPEALRLATEDARRPIDLVRGPLARFRLIRLRDEEHRLYITLHQMIFDGVSMYSVFLPELTALYEARVGGRPSPLREPSVQYGDFALWQDRRLREAASSSALDYWRRQLEGAPAVLELAGDRPRPPVQSFRGDQPTFALPKTLSEQLKALSRREETTLFMTLLAAFNVLLYRYTGQEDILVGTVTTRRGRPELERLLGFFLNTLVLRTRLSEDLSFRELLRNVRETTLEALSRGDVPIEEVVKSLQPDRDSSRNPLFQVMFILEPPLPPPRPGWNLTQMDVDTGISRFDLYLEADDRPQGIIGRVRYSTDLFERATIDRLLQRFEVLLEGIVADPGQRVAALPVLTPLERSGALRPGDAAEPDRPVVSFTREAIEQSIVQRFARQVEEHPRRIAVREAGREWTYAALDEAADRVAAAMAPTVGEEGARIALLLDHDAVMIAGILGVLKAGGAYVPLDPGHPAERLSHIVADCLASAVLTNERNQSLAQALAGGRMVHSLDEILSGPPGAGRRRVVSPDDTAYLLYTSGSAGRPKGVLQNHRNVLHFIRAYSTNLRLSADDRLTLLSSYSVDAAVMDIFGALLNGATLCPIDIREAGLVGLRVRLRRDGVTVYHSTPTVFRHLTGASAGEELAPSLRLIVLGGEEVRREDVEAYRRSTPGHCLFVNGFGPTESTVSLQHFVDKATRIERASVPVGRAVVDTEVLLLSPRGEPGQIHGEIAIRSRHLALGYWRRPLQTRAVFLPDPEGGERRIYRTGDMGRLLVDGCIEFAGRRDSQVKIRGFRIEMGEIEDVLARHPDVREAAVAVRDHSSGERRLIAYWVARAEPAPEAAALRRYLRGKLPDSMMPSAFVRLEALPLTPSGKIDRRALPDPEEARSVDGRAFEDPRDGLEVRLARLFERVLGTSPISMGDHFFDLGGHSLLAVRLFAEIEATFGLRIPLATLFTAPTVAQLAEVLRDKGASAQWSSLVPLQPGGRLRPFFGVHGHSGEVLFYRDLCRRLGPDQPFFALQSQGFNGKPPHRAVEAMAAHYLDEIRTVQPRGPYFLGGYCLGAIVAFEMAQQLLARGEEVALLALFVGYGPDLRGLSGRAHHLGGRLSFHLGRARSLSGRDRRTYLVRKGRDVALGLSRSARSFLWRRAYGLLEGVPYLPSRLFRDVEEMNLHAARSYVPRMYPGSMIVYLSGETLPGLCLVPKRDLDGLEAREMEVVPVPGGTHTMMQEPHVAVLGALLKARLQTWVTAASRS